MMITEQQRQMRRNHLGSSDDPIINNLSPYKKTPTDVYWSKKGPLPDESTESMAIGNWLEIPLLQWAAAELGVTINTVPEELSFVASDGPGKDLFLANLDALVIDKEEAIEAKFRNAESAKQWGSPGTDAVPYDVIVQVQHQMYVCHLTQVHVALATPSYYGVDRKLYVVTRDDVIIEALVEYGVKWWADHIIADVPPDGETTPPMYVLKALERQVGVQIRLPDEAEQWAKDYDQSHQGIKLLEAEKESAKAKLIHALGDADMGIMPNGRKVAYKSSKSSRFDVKSFRTVYPKLCQEFTVESFGPRFHLGKK